MNKFDNVVRVKLTESFVNLTKDNLDPLVFEFRADGMPCLRDAIRVQILRDIDEIRKVIPVDRFLMIGKMLSKNFTPNTDIEVSVQVDAQAIDSVSTAEILHLLKYINGHLAADTQHPINYYVIPHDLDETRVGSVFDIVNNRWIKTPKSYDLNIEKYITDFQETINSIDISTGELQRDLMDIKEINELDINDIKKLRISLKEKLNEVDEILKHLISVFKNPSILKQLIFNKYLNIQEILMFSSQNHLPESILSKLFEKYYYRRFINKVEDMLDDKNELDLTDVPKIKELMGDIWKTSQSL